MKLWSNGWINGAVIPARFTLDGLDAPASHQGTASAHNINPHLAWSGLPAGTETLALIFHDFDMPAQQVSTLRDCSEIAVEVERRDFFHWVLIDLPPEPAQIAEGQYSRGFVPRGKPPAWRAGRGRQGLNDCTFWWAEDPALRGTYVGYDGPLPPVTDALVHHYVFTLYALAIARLPVADGFNGMQVRKAMTAHVLAEATLSGTYTRNPRLITDVNARGPQEEMSE